ncbi:MAG: acyl-CoA dehydrogenase family protein, partial [Nitrososphaerales archaeon]
MISVDFSEADQIFQQTIRDFASSEIEPVSFKSEWDGKFSPEVLSKAAKLGLFGIMVPRDLGGASADLRTLVIATEELGMSSASMALLISFHNIVCDALVASNNLESKQALLSKLLSSSLGSLALDPIPRIIYKTTAKGLVLNGSLD